MIDVLFDEKSVPDATTLDQNLAERSDLWHQLVRQLEEMGGRGQWVWAGARYGWELKFKRGARPFATLTPKPRGFVVLVILGRAEVAAVDLEALGERMRATLEGARQLPDGRWLFHPIEVERDVADTIVLHAEVNIRGLLLTLKLPPTMRARFGASGRS